MIIHVQEGEKLVVRFADKNGSEIDGEFEVHFDTHERPNQIVVRESAGLPGSIKGRAEDDLYIESFGDHHQGITDEHLVGDLPLGKLPE